MIDRATHRTIVMHRITPSLKAGVEWNARAGEVGIVANWVALTETHTRPALMFGTSSDRIGTPAGQSYYATVSKSLHPLPVAPYVGVSYSGHADAFVFPFGVNVALPRGFSAMVMNDGVHTHLAATYAHRRFTVTLLAVERRHAGITLGTTF
ncbi:MAG TPA: hypothetical protein VEO54_11040 [Thermoanaerobaculia bacterium]|nr:hypothetical protein [Thermoanaerobaculia bacterium]